MELDNWKCDVQDSGLPPNSVPLYMTLTLRVKTLMPGLPFRPGFPHFILGMQVPHLKGRGGGEFVVWGCIHSGALHVLFATVRMLMSLVLGNSDAIYVVREEPTMFLPRNFSPSQMVSLHSPDWPRTCSVDQAAVLLSQLQVLGL